MKRSLAILIIYNNHNVEYYYQVHFSIKYIIVNEYIRRLIQERRGGMDGYIKKVIYRRMNSSENMPMERDKNRSEYIRYQSHEDWLPFESEEQPYSAHCELQHNEEESSETNCI